VNRLAIDIKIIKQFKPLHRVKHLAIGAFDSQISVIANEDFQNVTIIIRNVDGLVNTYFYHKKGRGLTGFSVWRIPL
jgi:hypothetical protein